MKTPQDGNPDVEAMDKQNMLPFDDISISEEDRLNADEAIEELMEEITEENS